nr:MAG TPA: minor tail protein [Caudoviricetes sp.]
MADAYSVRDLVVSLTLNSEDFKSKMSGINALLKQSKSEFRLAGAGVKDFEKTTAGVSAKLASLRQQQALLGEKTKEYAKRFDAVNASMQSNLATQEKYKNKIAQVRAQFEEAAAAAKQYKSMANGLDMTKPGAESAYSQLMSDAEKSAAQAEELKGKLKTLEAQYKACSKTTEKYKNELIKLQTAMNNVGADTAEIEAEIRKLSSRFYQLGVDCEKAGKIMQTVGQNTKALGGFMTRYITTPVVAAGTGIVKTAMDTEEAFAGVEKAIGGTAEEMAAIQDSIVDMSKRKPFDVTEIADVVQTAGQLGVARDNVISFTEAVLDLGAVSSDLDAATAAEQMAKYFNIAGLDTSEENVRAFTSTVFELGNTTATSEGAILEMSMRIAAAGHQVGMTDADILGLAATLSSVGLEAQAGGSAISKLLSRIDVAVATGSAEIKDFAKIAGMSVDDFVAVWQDAPTTALGNFINGLAQMSDEGISSIAVLEDMGLSELRLRDTILRTVNANDLFNETMAASNKEWKSANSLSNSAAKRYDTTKNKLKLLLNNLKAVALQFADAIMPTLDKWIEKIGEWVEKFEGMSDGAKASLTKFAAISALIGPALKLFGGGILTIGKGVSAFGKFASAVADAGGGLAGLSKASHGIIGKGGLFALITTAAVVGAGALIDYASGARDVRKEIGKLKADLDEWDNYEYSGLFGGGMETIGITDENFTRQKKSLTDWKNHMVGIWTDGRRETDIQINGLNEDFQSITGQTREYLQSQQEIAKEHGNTALADSIQEDIDRLDKLDAQIENLLWKRKNGKLRNSDYQLLDEAIDVEAEIRVKYNISGDSDGYEKINQYIETETAKAQARGEEVSIDVYGEGFAAAAQGYAAVGDSIEQWYNEEYAMIQLMEEGQAKRDAQMALDAEYNARRAQATKDYADELQKLAVGVYDPTEGWQDEGMEKAQSGVLGLMNALSQYDKNDADSIEAVRLAFDGIADDKDGLIDYYSYLQMIYGLIQQGMLTSEQAQSIFGIDPETELGNLERISQYVSSLGGDLGKEMSEFFTGVLPSEVTNVLIGLDMTQASADWQEWANNPERAILTHATVDGVTTPDGEIPLVDARIRITGWETTAIQNLQETNPELFEGGYTVSKMSWAGYDSLEAMMAAEGSNNVSISVDGTVVEVTPELVSRIEAGDLVGETMIVAGDGSVTLLVKPKIEGTEEEVDHFAEALEETSFGQGRATTPFNLPSFDSATSEMQKTISELKRIDGSLFGSFGYGFLNMDLELSPGTQTAIQDFITSIIEFERAGGELDDDTIQKVSQILELMRLSEKTDNELTGETWGGIADLFAGFGIEVGDSLTDELQGLIDGTLFAPVGDDVAGEVGQGMAEHDFSDAAGKVRANVTTNMDRASGSGSSGGGSSELAAAGDGMAAEIGEGMAKHDFTDAAQQVAGAAKSAVSGAAGIGRYKSVGLNMALGIAQGIRNGKGSIVAAMREAMSAALAEARQYNQIHSPSRLYEDEVGVMMMRGVGAGVLKEAKEQTAAVANAMRYFEDSAVGTVSGNDNRNYSSNSSVILNVDKLQVRDESDMRSLAIEIASFTNRRAAGRGMA